MVQPQVEMRKQKVNLVAGCKSAGEPADALHDSTVDCSSPVWDPSPKQVRIGEPLRQETGFLAKPRRRDEAGCCCSVPFRSPGLNWGARGERQGEGCPLGSKLVHRETKDCAKKLYAIKSLAALGLGRRG